MSTAAVMTNARVAAALTPAPPSPDFGGFLLVVANETKCAPRRTGWLWHSPAPPAYFRGASRPVHGGGGRRAACCRLPRTDQISRRLSRRLNGRRRGRCLVAAQHDVGDIEPDPWRFRACCSVLPTGCGLRASEVVRVKFNSHRQLAEDHSHRARQGPQGSQCHALTRAARSAPACGNGGGSAHRVTMREHPLRNVGCFRAGSVVRRGNQGDF
jgi:hypothetical protein